MSIPESTLLIIKPSFLQNKNQILILLQFHGFIITNRKIVTFSPEQAAEFYKDLEHTDPLFAIKVMALSSGASEAVILKKENSVTDLYNFIHYSSFSHCFLDFESEDTVHASESLPNARKEIKYIFPNVVIDQVSRKFYFEAYCGRKNLTGLLSDGILQASQNQVKDTRQFLSQWFWGRSSNLNQFSK